MPRLGGHRLCLKGSPLVPSTVVPGRPRQQVLRPVLVGSLKSRDQARGPGTGDRGDEPTASVGQDGPGGCDAVVERILDESSTGIGGSGSAHAVTLASGERASPGD